MEDRRIKKASALCRQSSTLTVAEAASNGMRCCFQSCRLLVGCSVIAVGVCVCLSVCVCVPVRVCGRSGCLTVPPLLPLWKMAGGREAGLRPSAAAASLAHPHTPRAPPTECVRLCHVSLIYLPFSNFSAVLLYSFLCTQPHIKRLHLSEKCLLS